MPNNRKQAMKRLIHLKDRLKRIPSYSADYKTFIDDLIRKEAMQESKTQDHLERLGLSHTMRCIIQTSLGKSEWSLIAMLSLMDDH